MLSLYTNGMGAFFDVVWGVSSVTKTIRGVSYTLPDEKSGIKVFCTTSTTVEV